jgi:hypothetical protein
MEIYLDMDLAASWVTKLCFDCLKSAFVREEKRADGLWYVVNPKWRFGLQENSIAFAMQAFGNWNLAHAEDLDDLYGDLEAAA